MFIDGMQQLQLRENVLGLIFDNGLSSIKMIKDKIQCRSQSSLNFQCTKYISVQLSTLTQDPYKCIRDGTLKRALKM